MQTKDCPSCGAEVPTVATRCKECFHDFEQKTVKQGGLMPLLGTLAAMAVVGAATFWYVTGHPTDKKILVDQETQSIIWTAAFQDGTIKTDRVRFEDVTKLEYVKSRGGGFEIVAITTAGDRKVVQSSPEQNIEAIAQQYAQTMKKPLDIVDKTGALGFTNE